MHAKVAMRRTFFSRLAWSGTFTHCPSREGSSASSISMTGIPSRMGYRRPHASQMILSLASSSRTSPLQAGQARISKNSLSITPLPPHMSKTTLSPYISHPVSSIDLTTFFPGTTTRSSRTRKGYLSDLVVRPQIRSSIS